MRAIVKKNVQAIIKKIDKDQSIIEVKTRSNYRLLIITRTSDELENFKHDDISKWDDISHEEYNELNAFIHYIKEKMRNGRHLLEVKFDID